MASVGRPRVSVRIRQPGRAGFGGRYIYPQNSSKLDPQSIKCVFIGYSINKKGYKCFCSNTQRVLETMDVTFFEENPYFTKSEIQNKKELQLWSGGSLLEQPQALESSPMSNSSLLSTKLQLSPLCASIPTSNSHSSEPNIPSSNISNPSSETRKVQVYTRIKRQFQGEHKTLACLTLVQESESNPMTAGTSTGGKNELEQKGS